MYVLPLVINLYIIKRTSGSLIAWGLVAFLFPIVSTIVCYFVSRVELKYRHVVTVDKYLTDYPDVASGHGISCIKCGSLHIQSWGISGGDDKKKIHSCNSCGDTLYKSGF